MLQRAGNETTGREHIMLQRAGNETTGREHIMLQRAGNETTGREHNHKNVSDCSNTYKAKCGHL